jgi:uncharacterized membrane protein
MNGASKSVRQSSGQIAVNPLKVAQRVLLGLFMIAIGFGILPTFVSFQLPVTDGAGDAIILSLALITTLVSLAGQLPTQNVLSAAVIIGVIGGGIHALGAFTGIPFGPVIYTTHGGPLMFNALPWFMPLLWIVVILNSRGVARLILRPWRKLRVYGYWLMGITTVLTLVFTLGLEPFVTLLRHYWLWNPTKLPVNWYGTPLTNFLGWLVTTLLILAFSTPSLMKKKPTKSYPDYHPLIVWFSANLLFIASAVSQHLATAAIVSGVACLVIVPFAVRGARW